MHYLAPPDEGPVTVRTTVERAGRQLSFVTGRLEQGERLLALSQAVFSVPVVAPEFDEATPPDVPPPEELERLALETPFEIPMRARYESRWAIGPMPFTGGDRAEAGGWIRLTEPRPADHVLLAAVADAWVPPVFSRAEERFGVPTIDLTIHFRSRLLPDDEWFLVVFRTRSSIEGFLRRTARSGAGRPPAGPVAPAVAGAVAPGLRSEAVDGADGLEDDGGQHHDDDEHVVDAVGPRRLEHRLAPARGLGGSPAGSSA